MSYNPREKAIKRSIELRKMLGAPANDTCEVEFFFYTDTMDNALDLMNELKKKNYSVECVPSNSGDKKFLITGNTPQLTMQSKEMLDWSNQMYDLAAEFNCEFDGWGALVENNDTVDNKSKNHPF
ncbi:MAG: ribonuclease E inhibitor RraB [Ignavibacteriales bacterium]|nr:ribonuclease E inhibitor RraB [Ignavibacteriales bacterium]